MHSDVRPLQKPHPLIMFGGASEGALAMGAAECDVLAIYAEPRATTAERIAAFRARAAEHGRSVDPVADTTQFGSELIPRIKAGAIEIDKQATPAGG
jgi:alkanesulfonate monooxygenase SsuD/methylene tetrahydromethanopterin reductase-like flavin-dependent oxidoreductase (luciferase family)